MAEGGREHSDFSKSTNPINKYLHSLGHYVLHVNLGVIQTFNLKQWFPTPIMLSTGELCKLNPPMKA